MTADERRLLRVLAMSKAARASDRPVIATDEPLIDARLVVALLDDYDQLERDLRDVAEDADFRRPH